MFEWRYLFAETILQRAIRIPSDAIKEISIGEQGLTATVQGTQLYTVIINNDFSEISCSCPCGFLYCKHAAAVLMECEKHHGDAIAEFFAKSAVSKLAMEALNRKLTLTEKRLEAERIEKMRLQKEAEKAERKRQWELDAPRREAERIERERLAEERRREREKHNAEVLARKQERERIKAEKEKAEAEKRAKERAAAERREEELRKELAKQAKKEKERQEIAKIVAAKRAEIERQEELDKAARRAIRKLPKEDKKKLNAQLAELDAQIAALEREEQTSCTPQISDDLAALMALDERGWLYPDVDPIDGITHIDEHNNSYFVQDGFRPWFGDDVGFPLFVPQIEVDGEIDNEDEEDIYDDDDE